METLTPTYHAPDRPRDIDRLRIAILAPPWFSVPPRGYGGIESVCHVLVEGLVARGHEVMLVGAGEAETSATFVQTFAEEQAERLGEALPTVLHAARAARAVDALEPDVVHDHTLAGPLVAWARSVPTVVTAHGPVTGDLGQYYRALDGMIHLVGISDSQRRLAPDLPWAGTVYNGIVVDGYRFRSSKDGYLLFLGRMSPDKAPHLAIEVARRAGFPLIVAAKCNEPAEQAYFEAVVRPRLGPGVEYVGQADAETKLELLAGARALLMPVQWEEPFGIVMVEALASGTPVVGLRRGSVPEIVEDGAAGWVCDDLAGMVEAVGRLDLIDPSVCRRVAEERFDASVTVDGYEAVYRTVVAREPGPIAA